MIARYQKELQAVMNGMVFRKQNNVSYTPNQIIIAAAKALWMMPEDVIEKTRERHIVDARYISITLIKQYCDLTLTTIGKIFSCDHTTVMYALETANDLIDNDRIFYAKYARVLTRLEEEAV